MNTNLLATIVISLLTNCVETVTQYERWEHRPVTQWGNDSRFDLSATLVGVNPLEMTRTITCARVHELRYEWLGKKHTNTHSETLWITNIVFKMERSEHWVPVSTNRVLGAVPYWRTDLDADAPPFDLFQESEKNARIKEYTDAIVGREDEARVLSDFYRQLGVKMRTGP